MDWNRWEMRLVFMGCLLFMVVFVVIAELTK